MVFKLHFLMGTVSFCKSEKWVPHKAISSWKASRLWGGFLTNHLWSPHKVVAMCCLNEGVRVFQWHLPEGMCQKRNVQTGFIKASVQFLQQKVCYPFTRPRGNILLFTLLPFSLLLPGFICGSKTWWLRPDLTFIFTSEETHTSQPTLPQMSSKVSSQVKTNDASEHSLNILH